MHSLKGQTHRALTLHVRNKHLKKGKIKLTVLDKPAEQLTREKIKTRDDAIRMRNKQQRATERHGATWSQEYLEQDSMGQCGRGRGALHPP